MGSLFSVTQRQTTPQPVDPRNPDPCGPYSQCRNSNNIAACSCLPGFEGSPPNCRPECRTPSECAKLLACINQKCRDPCPGNCGASAECEVFNHYAVCRCQQGYEGNPYESCLRVTTSSTPVTTTSTESREYNKTYYQMSACLFKELI